MSWRGLLVVAAVAAVTTWCAYLIQEWPPRPPGSDLRFRSAGPAEAAPVEEVARTVLVVLGDSFTAQSDASAGPEWPQLLAERTGWQVFTDAVPESGYVSEGDGRPFADRVPDVVAHSPDVIVVAGGVGDLGAQPMREITDAAESLTAELLERAPEAQLVLVSPFSNGAPGPLTRELSGSLQQIAEDHELPYVDATRWLVDGDLFGSDPDHPADAGQELLATRMADALATLEVAPPAGS